MPPDPVSHLRGQPWPRGATGGGGRRRAADNPLMSYKTIVWEQDGGLVTVTLNRPEMFNAMNPALMGDLLAAWERAGTDPTVGPCS